MTDNDAPPPQENLPWWVWLAIMGEAIFATWAIWPLVR